jgi:hypothetical protein
MVRYKTNLFLGAPNFIDCTRNDQDLIWQFDVDRKSQKTATYSSVIPMVLRSTQWAQCGRFFDTAQPWIILTAAQQIGKES